MASSTTTTTTTTLLATEDPSSSLARLDHQLSSLKISPTSYDLSDSSTLCNRSRSRHAASGSRFSLPRSFNRTHNAVRHFASSTSLFQSTGPFSGSVNPQLIHHKSDQQGQRPSLDHLSFLLPQEHTIRTRSLPTNHHFDPLSIEAIPDSGIGSSLDSNDDRSSITSGPASKASGYTGSRTRNFSSSGSKIQSITMVPTAMTQVTRKLIESKLLRPILEQRTLTDFHPFVGHVVPSQIKNGKVRCLRDLEILLLLYARHGLRRLEFTEEALERSLIVENYSRFSLFAITRIEDASLVIEKADLLRADDIRPYSQGYFVDLMDQVRQHARAVVNARHSGVFIPSEETLRIEGGLALTGAPIRLLSHFTRPLISDEQHDANQEHNGEEWSGDEDSAVRSMARRPKADADRPAPLILCKECNHKERRQCDMNKHMKQHSRPFKCPDEACKFHQRGFMGEKERDRHIDEQHNQNPNMFWCDYENCEYYSKRESNLKQHKENKHGWTYHRTRIVTTKANSAIRRQTTQSAKHGGSQIQDSKIILPLTDSDSGSPMEISQSSFSEHEGAHAWPTPEAEMRSLSSGSYRGTPPEVDNDTFLPAFNFGAPIGSVPQDVLADIPPMQSAMPPWQFPTPESGTNDQFSPRTNPVPSPSNSSPHLANRVPFSYGALQNVEGISPASLIYDQQVMHPSFSPTARPGAGDLTFTRTLADEGFGGLSATDDDFWGLDRETSWDRPLFEPAHGQMVASFNVDEELNFDLGGSQPNADVRTDTQYRY